MTSHRIYLLSTLVLERKLRETFIELNILPVHSIKILELLKLLKKNSVCSYQHCIRVGLLCKNIGDYLNIDGKALFYAGLFHDLGKCNVSKHLINKESDWSEDDQKTMRSHVLDGYNLLKGNFDFTAEVIVWHHKFQNDAYPTVIPPLLHDYSDKTQKLIKYYGRIVSIADVYDALHRKNTKVGINHNLTSDEIKEQLLLSNKDMPGFIEDLYKAGIFTV